MLLSFARLDRAQGQHCNHSKVELPSHEHMFAKRKSFNLKRFFAEGLESTDLNRWMAQATYGGNPEHKRNPGNFGLTPPASPRRDKTLCDGANIFQKRVATFLLKEGIRLGLVSGQTRQGFPQNVWAVTNQGMPLEAQLENPANGTYHGYPMPDDDPFRDVVIARWKEAHGR
jgi:hypothetical protein